MGFFYFKNKKSEDEIIAPFVEQMETQETLLIEQTNVIKEYENILDTQYVSIECDCKNGTFAGFFDKNSEEMVKCSGCNNLYRIKPAYEVVLVAEPLDNDEIFNELVSKSGE